MKKILFIAALLLLALLGDVYVKRKINSPAHKLKMAESEVKIMSGNNEIHSGDIIFQTSLSRQSKAIQLATHSKYSHCGIIYREGENYYVFEAVQLVKRTPLENWIARGEGGHYIIKRLKNDSLLDASALQKMKAIGKQFSGKDYDLTFDWSDDKIYCSELIWKIYQRATGLEIGKLQKLRDFDLSDEIVQKKMRERYGKNIPLDETVISPVSIFNSPLLTTIRSE